VLKELGYGELVEGKSAGAGSASSPATPPESTPAVTANA